MSYLRPDQLDHDIVADWQALSARAPGGTVRLVLADVDGVITGGEGQPADLDVFARLTVHNQQALVDPLVPAITLCTGRQAPYVELLAQMAGIFLPCIFEHGAGLFYPRGFRYAYHPVLGPDFSAELAAIRATLEEPLLRPGRAFVQPGKEASMTLYPLDGTPLREVFEVATAALADHPRIGLALNVSGVEIRWQGVDKGLGLRWLVEEVNVPLAACAGVGDSDPDLAFLDLVGIAAAPANGTPAVRKRADYVAREPLGRGLLEILDWLEARNRECATALVEQA